MIVELENELERMKRQIQKMDRELERTRQRIEEEVERVRPGRGTEMVPLSSIRRLRLQLRQPRAGTERRGPIAVGPGG